jgi:glycosyltransferase involved in cell wall biosynthesis
MNKIPTVTIGLPAYNEENNIAHLLGDLLKQVQQTFELQQIIVFADGCTDQTVQKVQSLADHRVKLMVSNQRQGIAYGLNSIAAESKTDILVILNSDILIDDTYCVQKLIEPLIAGEADFVAGALKELKGQTLVQKVLSTSMEFKHSVFINFKQGNNVFNCNGPIRAFSRSLYSKLRLQLGVADDMYSYFFAVSHNHIFKYVAEAHIFYKLPETVADYLKQNFRFSNSLAGLDKYFDQEFISEQIKIPFLTFFRAGLKCVVKHPVYFPQYIILLAYARMKFLFTHSQFEDQWAIAHSSKSIR